MGCFSANSFGGVGGTPAFMLQLSGKLSLVDSVTQHSLQMSWDHGTEAHGHLAVVDALVQSDAFVGIPWCAQKRCKVARIVWVQTTKSLKSHKLVVDTCQDKAMEGINLVKCDKRRAWDQIRRWTWNMTWSSPNQTITYQQSGSLFPAQSSSSPFQRKRELQTHCQKTSIWRSSGLIYIAIAPFFPECSTLSHSSMEIQLWFSSLFTAGVVTPPVLLWSLWRLKIPPSEVEGTAHGGIAPLMLAVMGGHQGVVKAQPVAALLFFKESNEGLRLFTFSLHMWICFLPTQGQRWE